MTPLCIQSRGIMSLAMATGVFKLGINANGSPTSNDIYCHLAYGSGPSFTKSDTIFELKNVWSSCRMAAVKIQFIPTLPNDTSATVDFKPLYIHYDVDGFEHDWANITEANILKTGPGTKIKNLYKPWKYFIKFPKRKVYNREFAANKLSTVQGSENYAGQWHDMGNGTCEITKNNACHVIMYGQGTGATVYGQLIFTMYWVLKDRFG